MASSNPYYWIEKKNSISISLIIENLSSFFSGLRGVYKGR